MTNDWPVPYKLALRIVLGLGIAFALYWAATVQTYGDCSAIHLEVHRGGLRTLGRILFAVILATILGVPPAVSAILAGLLTTPMTGSAITSMGLIVACAATFAVGRLGGGDNKFIQWTEHRFSKTGWFTRMRDSTSVSGAGWFHNQCSASPIPIPWFAAYCGATVRHLTTTSMLAGSFLGTLMMTVSHSFAGATIGCGVIDYVQGQHVRQYAIPAILSAFLVFMADRYKLRILK